MEPCQFDSKSIGWISIITFRPTNLNFEWLQPRTNELINALRRWLGSWPHRKWTNGFKRGICITFNVWVRSYFHMRQTPSACELGHRVARRSLLNLPPGQRAKFKGHAPSDSENVWERRPERMFDQLRWRGTKYSARKAVFEGCLQAERAEKR